jgi:hypothetical protein
MASVVDILRVIIQNHSNLQRYVACSFEIVFLNKQCVVVPLFSVCQPAAFDTNEGVCVLALITKVSVNRMARTLEGNIGECSGRGV